MANIRKGYLLSITTWENDADNYNTVRLDGLTSEDVKFYLYFAKHFWSAYSGSVGPCFGNTECRKYPDAEMIATRAAYNYSKPTSPELQYIGECLEKNVTADILFDIIGIWNEGESYRVFESFTVHFIPEEIVECSGYYNLEESPNGPE